jgi:Phosphotransferase enzyme family
MGASHTDADPKAWLGQSSSPAVEAWVRNFVKPTGPLTLELERAWSTVVRVPVGDGEVVWFKHCKTAQAFEPRLTSALYSRWPDRVVRVLAVDEERSWLLLADGGTPFGAFGNAPEAWEAVLPLYAELQIGEIAHVDEHLAADVPDLRLAALPAHYADMLARADVPLEPEQRERLRRFEPRFAELCAELAGTAGATVQHDDLHIGNVYADGDVLRILDWGDTSISHPFFSLVVTFRVLEEVLKVPPDDRCYARLRDAFLEPWNADVESFELAMRVGTIAHTFTWFRHRDAMPAADRVEFDGWFPRILGRMVDQADL